MSLGEEREHCAALAEAHEKYWIRHPDAEYSTRRMDLANLLCRERAEARKQVLDALRELGNREAIMAALEASK